MSYARDVTKKFADTIDFWAHRVDPAHETDRPMNHSLPEPKLGLDAGRLGVFR
jgi:hypothetical protein